MWDMDLYNCYLYTHNTSQRSFSSTVSNTNHIRERRTRPRLSVEVASVEAEVVHSVLQTTSASLCSSLSAMTAGVTRPAWQGTVRL